MNQITLTTKMTSLEIAEITGKNHADVLRDIRDEIIKLGAEIGQSIFAESSYKNSQNKEQPMYQLTRDGVLQLGARYEAKIRFTIIQRMNQLEEQSSPKVPKTYAEALLEAGRLALENEKLAIELKEAEPKVEFYNAVTDSKDTVDMATVAKVLNYKNIGRNKLFEILRDNKILLENNQPYQKYIDQGWFRQVESKWTKPNGDIGINIKTVVFQKGVDGIRKVLDKNV